MGRKLQEFFEVQYAQLPDDDVGDSPIAYNFHSADVVEVRAHVWVSEKYCAAMDAKKPRYCMVITSRCRARTT
jgi:hypothetical protein